MMNVRALLNLNALYSQPSDARLLNYRNRRQAVKRRTRQAPAGGRDGPLQRLARQRWADKSRVLAA